MAVKRIHPREVLVTPVACERSVVRVELLVALAVMLARKALATPWPLALEWLLLVVRAHVP